MITHHTVTCSQLDAFYKLLHHSYTYNNTDVSFKDLARDPEMSMLKICS